MRILLDVTRTLARRYNPTPTGIDRVEHAFIRWLADQDQAGRLEAYFVISTGFGHAALTRGQIMKVVTEIEERWSRQKRDALLYDNLVAYLERAVGGDSHEVGAAQFRPPSQPVASSSTKKHTAYRKIGTFLVLGRQRFRKIVAEARAVPTLFVHTSHAQLEFPELFGWLRQSGVKAMFYIHDVIPLDYPEYCGPASRGHHVKRLETVAEYGDYVVANSLYTRERMAHYLKVLNGRTADIAVVGLGTNIQDYCDLQVAPPKAAHPYFVCLGTIEGRKNLTHVINVWRKILHEAGPERTPRLLFVGRRGWECENVFDVLDRSQELAAHFAEVGGLTDVELAGVIHGATALLTPSWVEGYSLPPAEAICRGVPVIASDIPVHRELYADHALLIDPTDGKGWKDAVLDTAWNVDARNAMIARTRGFAPKSWDDFVADCFRDVL